MTYGPCPPWTGLGRLFEGDSFAFRFHLRPGRTGWLERGEPGPWVLKERRQLLTEKRDEVFVWTEAADRIWNDVEGVLDGALTRSIPAGTPRDRALEV